MIAVFRSIDAQTAEKIVGASSGDFPHREPEPNQ
jgi:hypothetical protein